VKALNSNPSTTKKEKKRRKWPSVLLSAAQDCSGLSREAAGFDMGSLNKCILKLMWATKWV
jgi:hypothetical protein